MNWLNIYFAALVVSVFSSCILAQPTANPRPPYFTAKDMAKPTLFGFGVISTGEFDSHPAFTPDGKTIYFVRSTPNFGIWTILFSRFENGKWRNPQVASFSGQYSDADPFITADGNRLYFISNRPTAVGKAPNLDIWFVERTGKETWSEPQNLGAPVNSEGSEWYPTLTKNGVLYFGSDRVGGKGRTDLYRSKDLGGKFAAPENLGEPINTQFNEFEPYVAPDEKFLIFMAGGRTEGKGGFDLYITYNANGTWSIPVNLGDKINSPGDEYSPTISPDGRYFFWTSTRASTEGKWEKSIDYFELMNRLRSPGNGLGDVYQIDLEALGISN
jgi:Tol biopolymer transport system component